MRSVQVAVVGGGPAGLSAAATAALAGAQVLLLDENRALGGQLRYRIADLPNLGFPSRLAETLIAQFCIDYHATLLTRDAGFRRFATVGLRLHSRTPRQ